jgi:hypothetical protein
LVYVNPPIVDTSSELPKLFSAEGSRYSRVLSRDSANVSPVRRDALVSTAPVQDPMLESEEIEVFAREEISKLKTQTNFFQKRASKMTTITLEESERAALKSKLKERRLQMSDFDKMSLGPRDEPKKIQIKSNFTPLSPYFVPNVV